MNAMGQDFLVEEARSGLPDAEAGNTVAFTRPPGARVRAGRVLLYTVAIGVGALAVAFGLYLFALAGKISGSELPPKGLAGTAPAAGVDRPSLGAPDAAVLVVEFVDFQCPFCRQAEAVVDEVLVDPQFAGRVRFVFRHFPLADIHQHAIAAARAAECAHRQGKFGPMRAKLFGNQDRLDAASLDAYAAEIGLDVGAFTACQQSATTFSAVEQDWRDGLELGVGATPTYFIGGQKIEGAPTRAQLAQAITLAMTQTQRE